MKNLLSSKLLVLIKNISIKHKLILSYLLLIVIPLSILTVLTYSKSSKIIEKNMISMTGQVVEQINLTLESKLNSIAKVSNMILFDEDVQRVLARNKKDYSITMQIDDTKNLESHFEKLQGDQDIFRIRVYVSSELLYANSNINFFNISEIKDLDWYKRALNLNGEIMWLPSHTFKYAGENNFQRVISAVRIINDWKEFKSPVGLECVDFLESNISDIFEKSTIVNNGVIFLADKAGTIFTSSIGNIADSPYKELVNVYSGLKKDLEWQKITLNGHVFLLYQRDIKLTGWKLAAAVPFEDMLLESITLRNYTFVLMILLGFTAYLIALSISFSIIKRINRLINTMRKVKKGDLDVRVQIENVDEVTELEENFNDMLKKMTILIDEKYLLGKEAKNAELKALQAQINPHFLYNTLELIKCKANKYKARDITDLVNSLARFYRLSLSNGKDVVLVGDEIAHIETYVYIQNKRFDDRIRLKVNLDEKVSEYSILKLVLQPIVENAILHGIMEKPKKTGSIWITGCLENENIRLCVRDDGVGISEETLEQLFQEGYQKDGHGFGINNVNKRIKINYGEEYGLNYISSMGQGTLVEILIPAVFL